ncbi:MAG: hypothetical protein KJ626_00850 [Verrucomicrobia bacterium]|nr:hypothetical protein [Verrucomicrobiota bacterium]
MHRATTAIILTCLYFAALMIGSAVENDFDGDGVTDFGCYYAPGGNWYFFQSTAGFAETQFGYAGTVPVMTGIEWASVILAANPLDGGVVSANTADGPLPAGSGVVPAGTVAQISATPNIGWFFSGWSDGWKVSSRTVVVPRAGITLSALFTRDPNAPRIVDGEAFQAGVTAAFINGGGLSGYGVEAAQDYIWANLSVGDIFTTATDTFVVTDLDAVIVPTWAWFIGDGEGPSSFMTLYIYDNGGFNAIRIFLGM